MYVGRNRRTSDDTDNRPQTDKKQGFDRSISADVPNTRPLSHYFQSEKIAEEKGCEDTIDGKPKKKTFDPNELPDGFCISPQRSVISHSDTPESAVRSAQSLSRAKQPTNLHTLEVPR